MPRGKKNLRRRSGAAKVTRRINPQRRKTPSFGARSVQAAWDDALTAHGNMRAMGLAIDPNSARELSAFAAARVLGSEAAGVELVDFEEVQRLAAHLTDRSGEGSRPEAFMKQDEVDHLQGLVRKHGDDFAAMARDIKTNVWQHSAQHLETRITRMRRFLAGKQQGAAHPSGAQAAAPAAAAAAAAPARGGAAELASGSSRSSGGGGGVGDSAPPIASAAAGASRKRSRAQADSVAAAAAGPEHGAVTAAAGAAVAAAPAASKGPRASTIVAARSESNEAQLLSGPGRPKGGAKKRRGDT